MFENRKEHNAEKILKEGNPVLRNGLLTEPSTLYYVGFDVLATTFPFDGVTLNKALRPFEKVAVCLFVSYIRARCQGPWLHCSH
jgi:hypothetical protein